jgi:hypothetical protein
MRIMDLEEKLLSFSLLREGEDEDKRPEEERFETLFCQPSAATMMWYTGYLDAAKALLEGLVMKRKRAALRDIHQSRTVRAQYARSGCTGHLDML